MAHHSGLPVDFWEELGVGNADPKQLFSVLGREGKGSFGSVFRARNVKTDEIVAVKVLTVLPSEQEDLKSVRKRACPWKLCFFN
jgi:hypothetical protein